MKLLNIHVIPGETEISVHFETTEAKEPAGRTNFSVQSIIADKFNYPSTSSLYDVLARSVVPLIKFQCYFDGEYYTECSTSYSVYRFPKDPVLALDFLSAFEHFRSETIFDHITFHETPVSQLLTRTDVQNHPSYVLHGTLNRYLDIGSTTNAYSSALNHFVASMLSAMGVSSVNTFPENALPRLFDFLNPLTKVVPGYKATNAALDAIYQFHIKNPQINLENCLEVKTRYGILTNTSAKNNILSYIQKVGSRLVNANRLLEMEHFARNFQTNIKMELFAKCVGKIAADNNKFHYGFTEWSVLRHAEFRFEVGIIIIPLAHNKGYIDFYAPGQPYNSVFMVEMNHMFKMLDLQLEPIKFTTTKIAGQETYHHGALVFDRLSSEKLLAMGIHFTPDYLRETLKPKGISTLYVAAQPNALAVQPNVPNTLRHSR